MIRRYKDGMLELDVTIFRNVIATCVFVQPVLVSSWTLVQRLCCDLARRNGGLWAAMSVVIHRLPCPGVGHEYTPTDISRSCRNCRTRGQNPEEPVLDTRTVVFGHISGKQGRPKDSLVVGGEVASTPERLI